MEINKKLFPVTKEFRKKALGWAVAFPYCSYLTSNDISYPGGAFPDLIAVAKQAIFPQKHDPFEKLYHLHQEKKNWLFGYFSYDLKNIIHGLESNNPLSVPFPQSTFFEAEVLILFLADCVEIHSPEMPPEQIFSQIMDTSEGLSDKMHTPVKLRQHMLRNEYLKKVSAIQQHILDGDCYELNLCQEFSARVKAEPLSLFLQLNQQSPAPFAAFLRVEDNYLICASPERFLKKQGDKIISQPIKGTIRRGKNHPEDEQLKIQLRNDEKELAENMMIVDLVRNDLAKSSDTGSIKVEELFGIYSFQQVHQMISTISSQLRADLPFTEVIKNAFPMGSMTGAPKRKVMELIEQYENSQRGLYSGSVGFVDPAGDMDFNVVIRSMLYNSSRQTLSFQVGGAITYDSVPEKEYEECLLKAKAMLEVLEIPSTLFS